MARPVRSPAPRRALAAVVAVLALGLPTAAFPISLGQLLQLPLEQLLRLEISALGSAASHLGGGLHGR